MNKDVSELEDWFRSHGLSKAELRVAMVLVEPLSNKEVGEKLFICEKTVKYHITNIFKKLQVKRRIQFVQKVNEAKKGFERIHWRVINHV